MSFRKGMPKYQRASSGLFALGLGLSCFSPHSGASSSGWFSELSLVLVAAGMSVLVAGMVAERREWEAQKKAADSQE